MRTLFVLLMAVFINTASLKSNMKLISKLCIHVPYDSAMPHLSILSRTFLTQVHKQSQKRRFITELVVLRKELKSTTSSGNSSI